MTLALWEIELAMCCEQIVMYVCRPVLSLEKESQMVTPHILHTNFESFALSAFTTCS